MLSSNFYSISTKIYLNAVSGFNLRRYFNLLLGEDRILRVQTRWNGSIYLVAMTNPKGTSFNNGVSFLSRCLASTPLSFLPHSPPPPQYLEATHLSPCPRTIIYPCGRTELQTPRYITMVHEFTTRFSSQTSPKDACAVERDFRLAISLSSLEHRILWQR